MHWLVGVTLLAGWNHHTGTSDPGNGSLCGPVDNGSGWGVGAGLSLEWLPAGNNRWNLTSRLTYEERPGGSFREVLSEPLVPSDPHIPSGGVVWGEIRYSLVNAEVLAKRELVKFGSVRIALQAGPAVQYVAAGSVRQGYETDSSAGICYAGEIIGMNSFRCSLKGGVQGEIGVGNNRWVVAPGIYGDYALTNVASLENRQINSLIFQIDFRTPLW